MQREFCCEVCGLIWFGEEGMYRKKACPECGNDKDIYACDTFGYAYAAESIKLSLEAHGKQIHYHKNHPWYIKK